VQKTGVWGFGFECFCQVDCLDGKFVCYRKPLSQLDGLNENLLLIQLALTWQLSFSAKLS
jgi:hypothetical protein